MIEKPDWDVVCHASAWDMYKASKDDFRWESSQILKSEKIEPIFLVSGIEK